MNNRGRRRLRQVLPEVRPSAAVRARYYNRLARPVRAMAAAVLAALTEAYDQALAGAQEVDAAPQHAADAAGDGEWLFGRLRRLRETWNRHFDGLSAALAQTVVDDAYRSNAAAWRNRANKAGFDVPMQLTAGQRAIMDVVVRSNVALIRSIPEKYFEQIEGDVTRGFLAGRDLAEVAAAVRKTGHSTVKRAALIARDQSNKMTSAMNAARQRELHIRFAYWKHSTVEKDPRPNHLRASREGWIYDVSQGIDFGDKFGFVLPGVAINCRCGGRSIIPGWDEDLALEQLTPVPGFPGAYTLNSRGRAVRGSR